MQMQIVIELTDEQWKSVQDGTWCGTKEIANGTPLPKGHGRLIDADALIDSLDVSDRDIYCKAVIEEDAPTIIEADGGDAE